MERLMKLMFKKTKRKARLNVHSSFRSCQFVFFFFINVGCFLALGPKMVNFAYK